MALSAVASGFRSSVLQHLRLPVLQSIQQTDALPTFTNIIARGFGGGFLDKGSVTDRVIHVAKHFEKVDPAKVRGSRAEHQFSPAHACPAGIVCRHVLSCS